MLSPFFVDDHVDNFFELEISFAVDFDEIP